MSEKLDGVRAYWDGKALISRLGNPFHAPDWFLAGLPDVPLDGELWIGRKAFQRTVGIVRRQDQIRPLEGGDASSPSTPRRSPGPFEERLAFVRDHVRAASARPMPGRTSTRPAQGLDHLRAELARVEALGGEGLMLRQPGSALRGRAVARRC